MLSYRQKANRSDLVEREIADIIAHGRTPFQEYIFFRSEVHGTCIVLDGDIQSCESDEAIYHEALVHPAILAHPTPETVLIMGGGEGATAREVLRHPGVKKAIMVDIDKEFVDLCRTHIPQWGEAAFADDRLEVHYMDINLYLKETDDRFDVVIGDLIDVADWDSPAAFLYGEKLYRRLKELMNPGAIVATQGGALDTRESVNHKKIRRVMGEVFGEVRSYGVVVPSFYHMWGYVVAGEDLSVIDRNRAETFRKRAESVTLEALGVETLINAFDLPRYIAKNIGA